MVRLSLLPLVAVLALAACSKTNDPPPPPSTCGTHAPAATATASPSSALPLQVVQLTATSTDADDACLGTPEARTYLWTLTSRPPASSAVVSDPASPAPTLRPDVAGSYQLEVVATDAAGHASAPAFVTVAASTCGELAPAIAAFAPVSGIQGSPVTLPAPVVSDPNCLATGVIRYQWELVARPPGSSAILSDPTAAAPAFVPDETGPYQLSVVVTNSAGSSSDPTFVAVNVAPCGLAAPALPALVATPATPNAGALVTLGLAGPIADPNGAICGNAIGPFEYHWTLLSRPPGSSAALTSETSPAPSFVADVPNAAYQVSLTVRDTLGNVSAPAFLTVSTSPCGAFPPTIVLVTANGTPNAYAPASVTAMVMDADNACAGFSTSIPSVTWSVVSAPAGSSPGLSASSTVPTSNGQTPPTFTATTDFVADRGGTYVVQATAVATNGTSASAQATLVVSSCGSHTPVITSVATTDSRGAISRPPVGDAVTMTVSAMDADTACGLPPPGLEWALLSAPAGSTAQAPAGPQASNTLTFTANVAGTYGWQVTAVDGAGLRSEPFLVTISTATCGPTLAPLAGFGEPIALLAPAVASPAGGYSLVPGVAAPLATAPPQDACIVGGAPPALSWSIAARPEGSSAVLSSATAASPIFTPDVRGTYLIQLVLTDDAGFSSLFSTTVSVECGAAPVVATVPGSPSTPDFTARQVVLGVNGGALTIVRSANPAASSATLSGGSPSPIVPNVYPGYPVQLQANVVADATCPQTVSYAWSVVDQPAGSTARLNNPSAVSPSLTPDLPGVYAFRLVLTDQTGRSTTATLATSAAGLPLVSAGTCGLAAPTPVARITGPILPPASGPAVEPMSTVVFDGSGSTDSDGIAYPAGCGLAQPLSYAWSLVSAPPTSTAALNAPTRAAASLVPDVPGPYELALDVSDGLHTSRTSLAIDAVAGYLSSAVGGAAAFTSAATDVVGNPVVAAWDAGTGAVSVARCAAGCTGPSPTWQLLGSLDSGLLPISFAPGDEPRPIAVRVGPVLAPGGPSFGNVFVTYFTGDGPTTTPTGAGMPRCALVVAQWNGTTWNRQMLLAGDCTPGGQVFGRSVSLDVDPASGGPLLAATYESGSAGEPLYGFCTAPACTTDVSTAPFGIGVIKSSTTTERYGKWVSLRARATPGGTRVDAAFYQEDDGAGAKALWYAEGDIGGGFSSVLVDSAAGADVGRFSSLAIVPPGTAANPGPYPIDAIVYADATASTAKFAACTNSGACLNPASWTRSTIADPSSNAGRASVLTVDAATGYPRAAYLDLSTNEVRVVSGSVSGEFQEFARFPGNASPAGLSITSGPRTFVGFTSGTGARVFAGP